VTQLKREGLIEAIDDFGGDLPIGGTFVLDQVVVATVQIADLSLNYPPAIRARLTAHPTIAAGGAGNFGGISVQVPISGAWIRKIANLSSTLVFWISSIPWSANVGAFSWNVVGDKAGQVRSNNAATDFVPDTRSVSQAVAPAAGFAIAQGSAGEDLFPFFVPGATWINCVCVAANTALDVTLAIQIPASVNTANWA
jgi:hypothetical protein